MPLTDLTTVDLTNYDNYIAALKEQEVFLRTVYFPYWDKQVNEEQIPSTLRNDIERELGVLRSNLDLLSASSANTIGPNMLPTELMKDNVRNYPFTVIPVTHRNTLTSASINLDTPTVSVNSGGTQETNKIIELRVEGVPSWSVANDRAGVRNFGPIVGMGPTVVGDFTTIISCQQWSNAIDRTKMGADSWAGIEYLSSETNLFPTQLTKDSCGPCARVLQSLSNPDNWMLVINSNTSGGAHLTEFPFTLPATPPEVGPGPNIGNNIQLEINPHTPSVTLRVNNNIVVYTEGYDTFPSTIGTGATVVNGVYMHAGLLLWSGTMTGATYFGAGWSGFNVVTKNTSSVGSGNI